jgi:hypothetical protein
MFQKRDPRLDRVALDLFHASVREVQMASKRAQTIIENSQSLVELAAKLDTPLMDARPPRDEA